MKIREKELLIKEIKKYKGNIPIILNSKKKISLYNMLNDEKLKRKILISNDAGILGNLLYKYKDKLNKEMIHLACLKDVEKYKIDFEKLPYDNQKIIKRMMNDKDMAIQLLNNKNYTYLIKYLPSKFKNDKQFYLDAVKKGLYIRNLDENLKNDREIALAAVNSNGWSLYCLSNEFKNDKEIVMESVKAHGWSLKFASPELKKDKEIVMEAIKQKGDYLLHGNLRLCSDKEFMLEAIKIDMKLFKYMNVEGPLPKDLVLEAIEKLGL